MTSLHYGSLKPIFYGLLSVNLAEECINSWWNVKKMGA